MASEYVSERGKEMQRSIHIELNATDSQVLGSLDSVSLPSEPPDIRNWFPSYVYESPELNTLDGFLDFDGSRAACVEEEKEEKSGGNQPVGECNDGLLAAAKESSDGIIKCNESNGFECSKSLPMVAGLSESLPFSSEPPDIKNWFSSYCYESPLLDTHEFTISDHEEREDGRLLNAEKSCTQGNKDVMDLIDVENSVELPSRSRISDVVVNSTDLVKDTKLDNQSVCKDGHNVDLKPFPAISSQSTSEKVSEQILPGQITGNSNHDSVKKSGNTNRYGKDCYATLSCSLINRTSPKLLKMKDNAGCQDGKPVYKSIGRKNPVKDSLEKENLHEIVSPIALDSTAPKGDSQRRPTDRSSSGKENEGTELLENGFISTRKKSSETQSRIITRCVNGVKSEFNPEKDAGVTRKVLSETSNIHFPNVVESSGKWLCPQKSKPNLGPPLKQLRLDQWVHRV